MEARWRFWKTELWQKTPGRPSRFKEGQRLRIAGKSIVDFVAFNLHDLQERFDQARTKTNQVKIFISTGDVLYSKRPLVYLVERWPILLFKQRQFSFSQQRSYSAFSLVQVGY
jgi:hypothetical protein